MGKFRGRPASENSTLAAQFRDTYLNTSVGRWLIGMPHNAALKLTSLAGLLARLEAERAPDARQIARMACRDLNSLSVCLCRIRRVGAASEFCPCRPLDRVGGKFKKSP